jgi:integrase/recombinase XerD
VKYSPEIVEELKSVGSGWWQPEEKCWIFPIYKFDQLKELKNRSRIHIVEPKVRLKELEEYMLIRNYSSKTIRSYCMHLKHYIAYANNEFHIVTINSYLRKCLVDDKKCPSYINQGISAIKLYCRLTKILSTEDIMNFVRPKGEKKLPKVMTKAQIKAIFIETDNVKYLTAFKLAYSSGMRVSEIAALKVEAIDSSQMIIRINQAKGKKDRIVPLSKQMLDQLRQYYREYQPRIYLFEGLIPSRHVSVRTLQRAFTMMRLRAGIKESYSFHSLRHSCATHMLETGTDLRLIQEVLGHASSKTTEIYTHITTSHIQKIRNPLDDL